MEIYDRGYLGKPLFGLFTFVVPILLVVNVPARILAAPLVARQGGANLYVVWAAVTTVIGLFASRWLFRKSLLSYRSASS